MNFVSIRLKKEEEEKKKKKQKHNKTMSQTYQTYVLMWAFEPPKVGDYFKRFWKRWNFSKPLWYPLIVTTIKQSFSQIIFTSTSNMYFVPDPLWYLLIVTTIKQSFLQIIFTSTFGLQRCALLNIEWLTMPSGTERKSGTSSTSEHHWGGTSRLTNRYMISPQSIRYAPLRLMYSDDSPMIGGWGIDWSLIRRAP